MFKIKEKIQFAKEDNRMQFIANTKIARDMYIHLNLIMQNFC